MFELIYQANELGFQPEADYLPTPVQDTEEVAKARADFMTAFDNFKVRLNDLCWWNCAVLQLNRLGKNL